MKRILGWVGGGVHKRIDENRELLELLQQEASELIASKPWIISWVQSNDDFFCELEAVVPLNEGRFLDQAKRKGSGFPRPWPGEDAESLNRQIAAATPATNTPSARWIEHAYPLQQIAIQLQGTQHSDTAAIINQLETIITRLRAGDTQGAEHDDDFGYRFCVKHEVHGPSFFDEPAASN